MLSYSLVRWAGATRWTVLRVCWNEFCVDMLIFWGSRFQALITLRQKEYAYVCVDLYVFVGIAVSCTGGYDVLR